MSYVPPWYGSKLPEGVVPPATYDAAVAFFEWEPRFQVNGTASREWERKLVAIPTPQPLIYAGQPVSRVRVHNKVAPWAAAAFGELSRMGLWALLNPYGGSYNFRLMKDGDRLSAHAYGAAFDFDPGRNKLGWEPERCRFSTDPRGSEAVHVLESWGWYWGGRWGRPDGMHFQWGAGW